VKKNKMLNSGLIAGFLIATVFMSGCIPAEEGGDEGSRWTMVIFMVLIFAVFYFLMIRPQRKRQKEHKQLVEELKRGDKVVTAGGIYGQIETISDDSVVMKIESGTTIRVSRSSVVLRREE